MVIKMNLDIRRNIKENLKDENVESLIETINTSITSNDELVLPGLGVLMELLWESLTKKEKEDASSKIIRKL